MTETRRTNRFALFFFIYFMAASVAIAMIPAVRTLSDSTYMLLAQLFCFLPPLAFYFFYTKKDVKQTLRLKPLGWKNALILLSFGVSIQPVMSLLSYMTALFFPNPVEQSIEGIQQSGLIISMLSVAIIPGLLEEAFSRGILLSGYGFLGKWKAAFASALLFGLLHMNPQQFLYAFVVGFIFCFLVDRTDSLYASILPHMVINGTTVVSIFTEGAGTGPVELEQSVILVTLLLMALLSLPWLALLLFLFLKINPPRAELQLMDESGNVYSERFITPAIIVIFVLYAAFGLFPYLST
ncbi:MAG: CPBP family intramembrane metalloprotease [Anaerotignum sp.]|nr:CPBP family intramembrane metalloprotease [Anaerotignum sp.]